MFDSNTLTYILPSMIDCVDEVQNSCYNRVYLIILILFQLNTLIKEVILLLNTYHKTIFQTWLFYLLVIYSGIILISLSISSYLSKFIFLWHSVVLLLCELHISAQRITVSIHDVLLYILLIFFSALQVPVVSSLDLAWEYFKIIVYLNFNCNCSVFIFDCHNIFLLLFHFVIFFCFSFPKYSLITSTNHHWLFAIQHTSISFIKNFPCVSGLIS